MIKFFQELLKSLTSRTTKTNMKDSDICLLYKNGFVETSELSEFVKGFSNPVEFSRHFINRSKHMHIAYSTKYCLAYVMQNMQNIEAVGADDIEQSISKCNYMYVKFRKRYADQENAF